MIWSRITIQRAKNGFIIKIEFTWGRTETYVIEGKEKAIIEVLKDVFASEIS